MQCWVICIYKNQIRHRAKTFSILKNTPLNSVMARLNMNFIVTLVAFATWRLHQMETVSASLAFCTGNSPVTGEFPQIRPVARSFDVFFDLCLNQQLGKQWRLRWFETPSHSLWRHYNDTSYATAHDTKWYINLDSLETLTTQSVYRHMSAAYLQRESQPLQCRHLLTMATQSSNKSIFWSQKHQSDALLALCDGNPTVTPRTGDIFALYRCLII